MFGSAALCSALVSFFYELIFVQDYLRTHPDAAPGWDHVLFGVVANVLVSVCAFASIALFFKLRTASRDSKSTAQ